VAVTRCPRCPPGETRVNSQELLAELRDAMEKVLG
jgi:hypothetical protein